MFVIEGIIDKSFRRKEATTGTSPQSGITSSHSVYRYELVIDGQSIHMEMSNATDPLHRGQRVVVAGFRSRGKLNGYAYKNLVSSQSGTSGAGLIGAFFGLMLGLLVAFLIYLAFVYSMSPGEWIGFAIILAILLNLANYTGGTVLRAWSAARAINLHEMRRGSEQGHT